VVRPGPAVGDQLVADAPREWKVGDTVAVEMAELPAAHAELDAAEPVWCGLHAGPGLHDRRYLFTCVHGHAH
jgi:hypothetical protein